MKCIKTLCTALTLMGLFIIGCSGQAPEEGNRDQAGSGEVFRKENDTGSKGNEPVRDQFEIDVRRHGGRAVKTNEHFFEVVRKEKVVRLYAYDHKMNRVRLDGVLGRIQLQHRGRLSESIRLRFHPEKSVHTNEPDEGYLEAHLEFSGGLLKTGGVVLFHLTGIPGTDQHVYFSVPVDE